MDPESCSRDGRIVTDGDFARSAAGRAEELQAAYREHVAGLDPRLAEVLPAELSVETPDSVVLGNGREVSSESLLAVLRRQVGLTDGRSRPIRADADRATVTAAVAWRQVVYSQVAAVLALVDRELQGAGAPNARMALEHGFRLSQLGRHAEAGDAAGFLQRLRGHSREEESRTLKKLSRAAAAAGPEWVAVVEQATAALTTTDTEGQLESAFEESIQAAILYRLLSESAHAGVGSLQPYLLDSLLTDTVGGPGRLQPWWPETMAHLVWSCWMADHTVDFFLVDGHVAAEHDALLDEIGLHVTT